MGGRQVGCKRVRQFVRDIERAGGEVIRSSSNHLKVYVDGHFLMSMSSSPSDTNSIKSAARQLRKMGLPLPDDIRTS